MWKLSRIGLYSAAFMFPQILSVENSLHFLNVETLLNSPVRIIYGSFYPVYKKVDVCPTLDRFMIPFSLIPHKQADSDSSAFLESFNLNNYLSIFIYIYM